jgi:hypothetical protein
MHLGSESGRIVEKEAGVAGRDYRNGGRELGEKL